MSILRLLHGSKDGLSAAEIGACLGWTHEQTYAALVALESRRAVRAVVQFTDKTKCSGVARWELMPAGVRLLLAGLREAELEAA
jgi:hypothetical protein